MIRRFDDPKERDRLRAEMRVNLARRGGADRLMISRHPAEASLEGRTLAGIAASRNADQVETAIAILRAGGAGVVSFNMIEDDIAAFMRRPWTITSSDGGLVPMGEGVPHPVLTAHFRASCGCMSRSVVWSGWKMQSAA